MSDETRQMLTDAHIDVADGLKRCVGKEELFVRLLKIFANDDYAGPIRAEIARGDIAACEKAVHKLKGSCGTLSMIRLHQLAVEIDEMLKDRRDSPAVWPSEAQFDELFDELDLIKRSLARLEKREA